MPKKILLADDSITIQKVVELTFSDGDYEVTAVNNGARAIAKLGEMKPDIILSDIIMPEKNGYEVCEYVKSHPEYRNIPVVLLTGTFEPFDPDRAEKAGCDAVVTKPFESQSLIHKVEELITNAQSSASAAAPAPAPEPITIAPPPAPSNPSPAASPWLDDEPAITEDAPSPFTTASGSFPTPAPESDSFTHGSDIFSSASAPESTADMPFEPPPAEPAFGGETRAFPRLDFDSAPPLGDPSTPLGPDSETPLGADSQQPPPAPAEPSPWDEQDFGGETRAFGKMTFDDLQSMQQPTVPQHPSTTADADAPFGAPPPAEEFSSETRAFDRAQIEDLQRQMSTPAPEPEPEPQPEPHADLQSSLPSAPEPSPWDEPAETPFGGSASTQAFPKMSFDDFPPPPPAEPQPESSPWDDQPQAFAGETRAFEKMSFDDLSAAAPMPEPQTEAEPEPLPAEPESAPEPIQASAPEVAPWGEPEPQSAWSSAPEPAWASEPQPEPPPPPPSESFATAAYAPFVPPPAQDEEATVEAQIPTAEAQPPVAEEEPSGEPQLEELPTVPAPAEPAWSPQPVAAAEAERDEPVVPPPALAPEAPQSIPIRASDLTEEQIDRIARRVVELMSDQVVRNIAWEVIPDLAEMVVKERIRQLESEA
jgi:CheY-like chemotaxis protein